MENFPSIITVRRQTSNQRLMSLPKEYLMKLKYNFLYLITITTSIIILLNTQATTATPATLANKSFNLLCSEWPPFEYAGNNGKPTGYSVEILQAILKELKIEDNIKIYPWKRAYMVAQSKKNTLIFTMARTKKREKQFKWIGPIAPRDIYLWKLKGRIDIKANNWEDIKKYIIGTVNGEAGEKQLLDMGFKKDENISSVTTQLQNYHMLYSQRIDFLYGLEFSTIFGLKKAGLNPDMVEKSLLLSGGLEYYFAFNPNTSGLIVEQFKKALQKVKDNGTFDKIVNKYREGSE
jgi:polar amino acid transport system substrate-binding protein